MTSQPSPDLAALSELLEKVTADDIRVLLDHAHNSSCECEHGFTPISSCPNEDCEDKAVERASAALPALLAAARRVPELEGELAVLTKQRDIAIQVMSRHARESGEAKSRADDLQAQLDEAKAIANRFADQAANAEARANAAEERVKGRTVDLETKRKIANALCDWINEGSVESPEDMTDAILALLPPAGEK